MATAIKASKSAESTKVTELVTEKEKALEQALTLIERSFGKGSLMRFGDSAGRFDVDVIPTGSLSLDLALGIGGIPRGRITEIYGAESSGKSTLAQHVIAGAQKQGGTVAYIDAEHAMDPTYAAACGINVDDLLISQPDNAEQALDITEALVRSAAVDAIVIDSVAALVPKAEIDGNMGDMHVGLQARLMSQALRKLTGTTHRSKTAVIFINQIREKVGVLFGSPEVTPGGRALKFYSSIRIDLRRMETIKQGTESVGLHLRARVVKNKMAPPFRVAEFDIMFGHGISREADLIDLGTQAGFLKKTGAFYSYGDVRLGQGRENAKSFLQSNEEIATALEQDIRGAQAPRNGKTNGFMPASVDDDTDDTEEVT
ncbi:MAG: recombinase RecA [Dehalococcoidia bacterium]|nr:recombinase RecA [Dehalococcoidia bacterium]